MRSKDNELLLIEDDPRIRGEVLEALHQAEFQTDVAVSVSDGRRALEREYALVLLDLGLPDGDGLTLVRELRQAGRGIPVVILTARDEPEQRVRGLEEGADDYVVKPVHLPELVARVRTILRRSGKSVDNGPLRHGDLRLEPSTRQAWRGEQEVFLKPREYDLLLFLTRHPGRAWTRDQLIDQVWGASYAGDHRTVDLHVRRLRAKVEVDPSDPRYIATVWGVGYRLCEESEL